MRKAGVCIALSLTKQAHRQEWANTCYHTLHICEFLRTMLVISGGAKEEIEEPFDEGNALMRT
jgi:hypothetical protein